MSRIQYLSKKQKQFKNIDCGTFSFFKTFDSYDINIIDLSDQDVWDLPSYDFNGTSCDKDLKTLSDVIIHSKCINIIFFLPDNNKDIYIHTQYFGDKASISFKDNLNDFKTVLNNLFGIKFGNISYEPNVFVYKDNTKRNFELYFSYIFDGFEPLMMAKDSNKPLAIKGGRFLYAIMPSNKEEDIISFLNDLSLIGNEGEYPDWLEKISILDDATIMEHIQEQQTIISNAQKIIDGLYVNKNANSFYKGLLFYNGSKLVEIVKEVLTQILPIDVSGFVDEHDEDLRFSLNGVTFIVEIKGVNKNVQRANISQVDDHLSKFLDSLDASVNNVQTRKLLIINHQRLSPIEERVKIEKSQIEKAIKDETLIIETTTLLKMFELFKNGTYSQQNCVDLFLRSEYGLLKL